MQRVEEAKKRALDYMTKPNFATAKVIYEHLPEFGKEFDPKAHIAMTTDVTGPGIFVIKEFADKASVDVELYDVPVIDRKLTSLQRRTSSSPTPRQEPTEPLLCSRLGKS